MFSTKSKSLTNWTVTIQVYDTLRHDTSLALFHGLSIISLSVCWRNLQIKFILLHKQQHLSIYSRVTDSHLMLLFTQSKDICMTGLQTETASQAARLALACHMP